MTSYWEARQQTSQLPMRDNTHIARGLIRFIYYNQKLSPFGVRYCCPHYHKHSWRTIFLQS
ncbi:MAG: hypothetical protein XXXJIFNMEKO3_00460 [Candidatus Erwinia impunctatus]|nr:hypothetical protein XXXJIFNMEKO_00460 [Culicoides impunctatus]